MNIFTSTPPCLLILTSPSPCVLTPDPIVEGINQHTVYHRVSCCKLQLSKPHQSFLYFTVIFHLKWKQSVLSATLYVKNDSENYQFEFCGSTTRNEHAFWWPHSRDMPLSTQWPEDDILWTLNDVFSQKLAILRAIWAQIRSSMYLRWNYISFYQL